MVFRALESESADHLLLVCIHETREQDVAAFRLTDTRKPDRSATHVSWHDAHRFCEWLTRKEQGEGRLSLRSRYRLPTDHEWSQAAGIAHLEPSGTPEAKCGQVANQWSWGSSWPPPANAANCLGSEGARLVGSSPIPSFRDSDAGIARAWDYYDPKTGYCSLTGNVWEWCEDEFRPGTDWRVLRGGSWKNNRPESLLLSHRTHDPSTYKSDTVGFRVVLERCR
jgi:formylglycine-generating enzyme required for sulfatase activity